MASCKNDFLCTLHRLIQVLLLRRLSNDYSDGNKYGKKAIGLDNQNNKFERVLRFWVHFLPSLHDYGVKVPSFCFLEDVNTRQHLSFFFPELRYIIRQIERDGISALKFEAAPNSLFKWHFRSRRCSLSSLFSQVTLQYDSLLRY